MHARARIPGVAVIIHLTEIVQDTCQGECSLTSLTKQEQEQDLRAELLGFESEKEVGVGDGGMELSHAQVYI